MKTKPILSLLLSALTLLTHTASAQTPAEQLVQSTIKIFNESSTATGWLVRDHLADSSSANAILITAKHVLNAAKGNQVILVYRYRDDADIWQRLDHTVDIRHDKKELWTSHPNHDIAALRCTLPDNAAINLLSQDQIADEQATKDAGVTVGTQMFLCGYPYRTESMDSGPGFPLFRQGVISSYPIYPVASYPTMRYALNSFEGDSGSPIGTIRSDGSLLVIGLQTSVFHQNDNLSSSTWTLKFKRDLGIGIAVHSHYIRETIELLR